MRKAKKNVGLLNTRLHNISPSHKIPISFTLIIWSITSLGIKWQRNSSKFTVLNITISATYTIFNPCSSYSSCRFTQFLHITSYAKRGGSRSNGNDYSPWNGSRVWSRGTTKIDYIYSLNSPGHKHKHATADIGVMKYLAYK